MTPVAGATLHEETLAVVIAAWQEPPMHCGCEELHSLSSPHAGGRQTRSSHT
jgi:hypothetical protein